MTNKQSWAETLILLARSVNLKVPEAEQTLIDYVESILTSKSELMEGFVKEEIKKAEGSREIVSEDYAEGFIDGLKRVLKLEILKK